MTNACSEFFLDQTKHFLWISIALKLKMSLKTVKIDKIGWINRYSTRRSEVDCSKKTQHMNGFTFSDCWKFHGKRDFGSSEIRCKRLKVLFGEKAVLMLWSWKSVKKHTKNRLSQLFNEISWKFNPSVSQTAIKSHSKSSKSLWSLTASTNGEPRDVPSYQYALYSSLW